MVLRRALLLATAAGFVACIPKAAPPRAKSTLEVRAAFVNDRDEGQGVEPLPDAAVAPSLAALKERNLAGKPVGREVVDVAFRSKRATAQRLAVLANAEADLVLLVETRVRFYSQLNGRYRWTVAATVSLGRRDAIAEAATSETSIAVFLDYDHQREPEALAAAGPRIADEVARLADELVPGLAFLEDASTRPPSAASLSANGASGTAASLRAKGVLVAGPAAPAKKKEAAGDSIYFVMVDRFVNGDPKNDGAVDPADPQAFHGGDLAGLLGKLDYLQSLGITTVWISPVFAMRTEKFHGHGAYHGYWTSDFGAVEPRFGDEALLKKLSDELHRRGMKLVLDLVLNHVGPETPLTKEHPDWFHGKGAITDWNDASQLHERDVFGLPDLAQEKPEVYKYLLDHSLSWIRRVKPDGFRLDAARHVPSGFWARYTRDVTKSAGEKFLLYGEMYDGDAEGLSRTLAQAGFDAVFDFPLYFAMTDVFCKGEPPARLAATLTQDRLYPDARRQLVTFLDNHDLPRLASQCGGDLEKLEAALAFLLTARGTPSFTYGTESVMTGEKEPENRGDMVFAKEGDRLAAAMRELHALRRDHRVFRDGLSQPIALTEEVFAYARLLPDAAALVAVNRGASEATVALPAWLHGAARDARTGESLLDGSVTVPANGIRIAHLSPKHGTKAPHAAYSQERLLPAGIVARGISAREDETVAICGGAPELGGWNPARAKALRRAKDGSYVGELALPAGVYEWKLLVRSKDGTVRWEGGKNRALFLEKAGETAVEWRVAPAN